MGKEHQKIVVICGPTASGKTNLALQLAKVLPKANLLSVDSRQAYQDLDIVTGKDVPEDLPTQISIFGQGIFKSNERANVADFLRYSQQVINRSKQQNTPLIIVGGTGLYLRALTQNLSNILIPPNETLRSELETLSLTELQDKLRAVDHKKYSSLNHSDFMNPRRLIRYIEIALGQQNHRPISMENHNFSWIGIMTDKKTLEENILQRVVERLNNGAVEEVSRLLKKHPDRTLPIYSSLGVSQIINYLDGKIDKKQLIDLWAKAEVDYARRQMVWFKKQSDIVWYDKNIDNHKLVQELSKIYLKNA